MQTTFFFFVHLLYALLGLKCVLKFYNILCEKRGCLQAKQKANDAIYSMYFVQNMFNSIPSFIYNIRIICIFSAVFTRGKRRGRMMVMMMMMMLGGEHNVHSKYKVVNACCSLNINVKKLQIFIL